MATQALTNPYWLQQVFSGQVKPAGIAYLARRSALSRSRNVFNVLPAFGDCIAVGNTAGTAVRGTITTVATTAAACAIATRISRAALGGVPWDQRRVGEFEGNIGIRKAPIKELRLA
jgi:hypothetical protein